ncbi:MAG TPA: PilZ domain-containing protein [Polyangiaceae bacterium]|nr:PilZ domain-containing protein [Polyangiaceae bacterium]
MTDVNERRAAGSSRVQLDTLVEICGNEMGTPAFEAEALDVSARGMHLRTAYLPEEGAPLVCRFEDHGREIVVEGVVAWRKESKKGGDFGVKFTALDSRSVDSLRELVKRDVLDRGENDDSLRGSKVRLHIEGLGSPMKARVRTGGTQKVQVGSNLEFLKVGRKLEIEDLEAGGRREARIDGVEVVVDAQTQVPQLVVALRYEGVEDTPEPSVLDLGGDPVKPASLFIDAGAVTTDAGAKGASPESQAAAATAAASDAGTEDPTPSGDVPATSDDELGDAVPAATRAARRIGSAAEHAGEKAREASIAAAKLGSNALSGVGKLLAGASAKIAALRGEKAAAARRRTTSPPPEGPMSVEGKRLRPQSSKRDGEKSEGAPSPSPVRRITKQRALVGAAGIAVLGTALAIGLRPSKSETEKPAAAATAAPEAPVAAAPAAQPPPAAAPMSPPGAPITANVPLFGATPMATAEPAPLGPPPTPEAKAVEQAELASAKAAEPAGAEDEEFVDEPSSKSAKKDAKDAKGSTDTKPEDVAAWGRGKMHLPTIYRIRLDGPGSAIHGAVDPMGFTVLIPSRKLMEHGDGLAKRDARFARVRTTNTPGGAQVRIAFKSSVPAYRVRLRRDYIELLVSAPEESSEKKPAPNAIPAAKAKPAAKPAPKAKPAAKTGH